MLSLFPPQVNFFHIQGVRISNPVYGDRLLDLATCAHTNVATLTWLSGDAGSLLISPKDPEHDPTSSVQYKAAQQAYGIEWTGAGKILLFLMDRVLDNGSVSEQCTYAGEIATIQAVLYWDAHPRGRGRSSTSQAFFRRTC